MNLKFAGVAAALLLAAPSQASAAQAASPEYVALNQCVSLSTTGADRILTARWLFAVMATSSQIADLSAVTAQRRVELDKSFARLVVRLVTRDCLEQVRPLAAQDFQGAFEQVGRALGETAMGELLGSKEVEKGVSAYADYVTEQDFKPLIDSLPKQSK